MSLKLWQIDEKLQQLIDQETGELKDVDAFMALQMERDAKIQNTIKFYKNTVAEAAAIKAESQALAERAKVAQNRADRLKSYLEYATAGQPYKSTVGDIVYRKSTRVDIGDNVEVPDDYMRIKKEYDKTKIKEALKQGITIKGVSLKEYQTMSIN